MAQHILERLAGKLAGFRDDRRGSMAVESVIVFPILIWAYLGMFTYWEAFRTENTNSKAAYVIADMLSRQTDPVDVAFIEGLGDLYAYLTRERFPTAIRVSSIGWDSVQNDYMVRWSHATQGRPALTTADAEQMDAVLPNFPAGDTVLLIESVLDYSPIFKVGLADRAMTQFVYTRPRFVSAVPFDDGTTVIDAGGTYTGDMPVGVGG